VRLQKNYFSDFIIPLLLFLLNFILKVIFLDNRDVAGDEPFSIFHAQKELSGIIQMLKSENNPPLHFFLLHFWIKLFGISSFSVRFPSLVFSALTSVILFRIGNRFFDMKTGITAALIFTFSTMHIYFSHEARVYSLFVLLTAWSLFLYLKMAERPERTKNYMLLFIADALLIYSHYFGFFVVFVQLTGTLFVREKNQMLKKLLLVFLALLIAYIPNIVVFASRFHESIVGTWVTAPEIGQSYGFLNLFINGRYNMMVLLVMFILGGIILLSQKKILEKIKYFSENSFFKIILIWFVIPYFLMFIISFKLPMFIDRYILYTSIPFYLLIAVMLNYLFEKKSYRNIAILLVIACLIYTVNLNPDNNRRLKEAVEKVKELKKENDIVIISPDYADLGFTYYYNISYFKDYDNIKKLLNNESIYPANKAQEVEKILSEKKADVVYLQAGNEFVDPDNLVYKKLESRFSHREQFLVYRIYYINRFYNN
jgi:mannosyltransferase